jgi:hypothetical protein
MNIIAVVKDVKINMIKRSSAKVMTFSAVCIGKLCGWHEVGIKFQIIVKVACFAVRITMVGILSPIGCNVYTPSDVMTEDALIIDIKIIFTCHRRIGKPEPMDIPVADGA